MHGGRRAQAYNEGLGAVPPSGFYGQSRWSGGQGASPPWADEFLTNEAHILQ